MKLLVYSWFPVLARHQAGGAQQAMHDLLTGFAGAGLDVTVICPEAKEGKILSVNENLRVLPVLKEFETRHLFPYEHLHNLQQVAKATQSVDVVWTIDSTFPLDVPQPIVLTLDCFCYKNEMRSLLSLNWDGLIVTSRYLWRIAMEIVGPEVWEGAPRPIEVVPYAVDAAFFKPIDPENLCARLGLSKSEPYLLFPHRPDPKKGFKLALQTLYQLRLQGESYKLLIPMNETYKSDRRYYNLLRAQAREMGIGSFVIFHEWITLNDLPAYYSLGRWTLTLSTVPEGFGLTPVQSISCGTPVISSRAGALAEQFPPGHGVEYVDFNAMDQIVASIVKGISKSEVARGQTYVRNHYNVQQLVQGHLKFFEGVLKSDIRYNPLKANPSLRLSPWCHLIDDSTVWHDYRRCAYKLTQEEAALIRQVEHSNNPSLLEEYKGQVAKLLDRGILLGNLPEPRDDKRRG